ncbi:FtsX-like permease family protein [Iocasia frigidifontis]|uniref:FtsX-like permease family protein n=1 Tax=Iocasia fonsfrigidae TaxID=2682810 RepID=UPI001E2C8B8A|nr:FtsX-like permease family protein [Iocasia fonsfrigidae]
MKLPPVALSIYRNRKQLYFLIVIISLVSAAIFIVSVLTRYVSEVELRAWKKPLNNFSIVRPTVNVIDNYSKRELRQNNQIQSIISFKDAIVSVPGILNYEYRPIFALGKEDIEKFMKYNNLCLMEGHLPKKDTREIILSSDIIRIKKLQINDYIGNAIDKNEFLWGRFKVTGIIAGNLSLGIASLDYFKRKTGSKTSLILFTKNDIKMMNRSILRSNFPGLDFQTARTLIENYTKKNKNLIKLIWIITGILTISLTLIVGLYLSLYLQNRLKEYALFYSNGVSRSRIIIYVIKEMLLVTIVSFLSGLLLSVLFILFLKYIVFKNIIFMAKISLDELLLNMPIFIAIIFVIIYISIRNINNNRMDKLIMGV